MSWPMSITRLCTAAAGLMQRAYLTSTEEPGELLGTLQMELAPLGTAPVFLLPHLQMDI